MNHCKTCKHWTEQKGNSYHLGDAIVRPLHPTTYEEMEPHELPFEVRYCTSPKLKEFQRPVTPDEASTVDGSEYWSALVTGPEFGCVNHEEANG